MSKEEPKVRKKEGTDSWLVTSTNRDKEYTVTFSVDYDEYNCSCIHGLNNPRNANCYHVKAAVKAFDEMEG